MQIIIGCSNYYKNTTTKQKQKLKILLNYNPTHKFIQNLLDLINLSITIFIEIFEMKSKKLWLHIKLINVNNQNHKYYLLIATIHKTQR